MSTVTNEMRIAASQFAMGVMNATKAFVRNDSDKHKAVEKIQDYLPKFKARITFQCASKVSDRYFTALDRKRKGKKRVYVSTENGKNDLYIFYIQAERLVKLCDDDPIGGRIANYLGNRWIMTNGVHEFKSAYQLMSHVIAAESSVKKGNKPSVSSVNRWLGADELVEATRRYRTSFVEYNIGSVDVEEFSFEDECNSMIQ